MSLEPKPQTDTQKNNGKNGSRLSSVAVDDSNNVVIIAASLVFGTSLLALLLGLVHTELGRIVLMVSMVFVAISIGLAYRNILRPAQIIAPTVAFLVLTFFLVEGDGVHDASITAYSAIVILAGLLLGEFGVLIFGTLTTVSLAAIVYGEYSGIATLQTDFSGLFDLIDVNTIWILQLATSVIIYFLVRRLSRLANAARAGQEEFARANKELENLRDVLQERVEQRTEILEKQNSTLQSAVRVANEVLAAPDVSTLLRSGTELIASEFGYDHTGIFLLNEKKDRAILQSSSSEHGKKILRERYELNVDETSLVGFVAKNQRLRIIINEGADKELFNDPYLSGMQSAIALPLVHKDDILGILDVHSKDPSAFTQGNMAIFQTLSNQIALTIQNTRLIEEARINLTELELVVAEQSESVWNEHLQQKSYGFMYTPLGVKSLRTARVDSTEHPSAKKAEMPILLRGRKIGSISMNRLSRHWTQKEKDLLTAVSTQIGLAIENARLLYETREQAHQEQLVSDVSTKLRETLDLDTVLKTAIEEMRRTFNLKEVEVRLSTDDTPEAEA